LPCSRFATKESATHAIVAVHNSDINGQPVKCSWGKESGEPIVSQNASQVCSSQVSYELQRILLYCMLNFRKSDLIRNLTDLHPSAIFSGGAQQHTVPVYCGGVRSATRLLVSAELSGHTATGTVPARRPRLHVWTVRLSTRVSWVSQQQR